MFSSDSQRSLLSVGSSHSVLSFYSVGSFMSIGSVGSAFSLGSVGSFGSFASVMSFMSTGSFLSALSTGGSGAWRRHNLEIARKQAAVILASTFSMVGLASVAEDAVKLNLPVQPGA